MPLTFHRTDERILIKYIDDIFNIFSCIIPYHDKFVIDYCNSKLEKLEKLLNNYILEEHDNKIILKVEEPICINYTLNKQPTSTGEQSGLILSKLKQLEKENKILKEKLEDTKFFYIEGYTFPINKDIQQLDLNLSLCPNIKPCNTINLSSLSICNNLTKFGIDLPNISTLDFTPFNNLLELTIINEKDNIKSILGFEKLKKLNYLKYQNSFDADIQKTFLENCTSLQELYIKGGNNYGSEIVLDLTNLQFTLNRLTIHRYNLNKIIGLEKCKLLKYLNFNNIGRNEINDKINLSNLKLLEEINFTDVVPNIYGLINCINLKKIRTDSLSETDMSCFQYLELIEIIPNKEKRHFTTNSGGEYKKIFTNLRTNVKLVWDSI